MLLRAVRWGLAGVLVAWTVLRLFGLERGWPLVPLFAFTPWVAGLALLAAIGALVFGRFLFALLVGACAVVLLVALAPRVIPNRAPADAPGVRLRVLSANVAAQPDGRPGDGGARPALPPGHLQRDRAAAGGGDRLSDRRRHRAPPHTALHPLPGFSGTGLYSKLPLRLAPAPAGTRFGTSAAAVSPPGAAPFELLAVHIPAPTSPGDARDWRHDMRALPPTGDGGAADPGRRLQRHARPRRAAPT